jgi:chromosomal replication initiator protein
MPLSAPEVYGPFLPAHDPDRQPTIRQIQREVCMQWPMSIMDMLSHRRTKEMCEPRQVAMALVKALTTKSLPEIGRHFGDRDHTTVLHSTRKYQWLIDRVKADVLPGASLADWVMKARYWFLIGQGE